ncbi:MAG TPA: malto-oligosyltrehalose trehalohydrolase [Candidatus Acidoferrum sp.]|nr:malto-oligosyltrehalose trehalohydrolase [Candidatus Acidoferrum sp.]
MVEVVADGRVLAMKPAGRGWWEISDELSGPGTRYGYSLDGGDVRPDPRSASQPGGVLGLSEVVDQAAYSWSDAGWKGMSLDGVVIYELHAGTFSPEGTFDGIVERLPHLVALGIDAIELMPVAEFSGDRGWGYDGVDLFAPHHAYGGPAGLKRLVDACHLAGLGVVMDVVYNHLGPVGNFLSEFGPYFSDHHHTPWGAGFNFDGPGSDEARRFVLDNALMWIRDYHIDGLRLDAANTIADESPLHLLAQLTMEVAAIGDNLQRATFVTAESDLNDPRFVRSRADGGYGFQAAWSDDWHHAMHATLTGERTGYYEDFGSMEILAKALRQAWAYDGEWSPHRQRIRGGSTAGLPPEAFVIAIQNHDQVGNRAAGERLAVLVDEGALKAAAALLLTAPFTSMLFQGEEWAASSPFLYFTDHGDPDLGKSVSEGRRREFARFGWDPNSVPDPQDLRTFARSKLLWGELDTPFHHRMLEWYRGLIRLRRRLAAHRDLAGGAVRVQVDAEMRTVAFDRHMLSVRVNLGEKDWISEVSDGVHVLMASDPAIRQDRGCVRVRPSNVVILESSIDVD